MSIETYKRWLEKYEAEQEHKKRVDALRHASIGEVNEIYRAYREAEARRQKEATMHIKIGDRVRLKDSPYTGTVKATYGGTSSFTADGFEGAITADDTLLEQVISPQVGDIYEDVNGNEWVIFEYGRKTGDAEPFLVAQLTGIRPPSYAHRSIILNTHGKLPSNLDRWITMYSPKLRRRRGQ